MDHKNDRARGQPGAGGTAVSWDDRDPITTPQGKTQRDRTSALLITLRAEHRVLAEYRPSVLGIRAAVHAAAPGVRGCALARPCRCDNYLKALAAGGPRFAPSGEVSEENRAAAVLILSRRAEKAVKPPQVTRLLRLAKPRRRA
jgi:hypothetical protein